MLFDGRSLFEMDDRELAQQRIRFGFVFQQAALFDSMTVAKNIAFPLRQHTEKRDFGNSRNRNESTGRGRIAGDGGPRRNRRSYRAACGSASASPGRWP